MIPGGFMRFRLLTALAGALLLAAAVYTVRAESKAATVKGYVIDSACTFTKNLKKPISAECAQACAKAGSPLVILADNGSIYWPTTDAMPATSQNDKLLPFAGKRRSEEHTSELQSHSVSLHDALPISLP